MGQLEEFWEWLPIRVIKRQGEVLEPGSSLRGYIYRNWRGNYFLLDEEYGNQANETTAESTDDEAIAEVATLDEIAEEMPLHEAEDRLRQLDEMWEQPTHLDEKQG